MHRLILVLNLLFCVTTVVTAAAEVIAPLDPAVQAKLDAMANDNERYVFLQELAEEKPDDAAVQYHLGNAAFDTGKLEDARAAYEKAIANDPELLAAHVNLGSVLDEMGKLDEALRAYERALAIDPNEPRALCNIGNVYFKKSRHEKAIEYFQKALEADPKSQLAHYNLAIMFADSQIYREAIAEWEACVAIDPDSDLGKRSADNIEIIRQMMAAETPDLGDR